MARSGGSGLLNLTCHGPWRVLPARSNTNALAFARTEIVSDQIMTRAQGKQGDSRVLQGT